MFDGVSSGGDLFHQLMAAASSRASLPINIPPLPSSFTLHHQEEEDPPSNFSAAFDNAYSSSSSLNNTNTQAAPSLLHLQEPPHNNNTTKDGGIHDHIHDADDDDVMHDVGSIDPWSNDEVLALFKLRSTMEIWFPDFTWHHISRKLGELGYKRSAEQCKERFDQESKHLNTTSTALNYNKVNYRNILMTDEFYPPDHNQEHAPQLDHHHHHHQDDERLMYKNVELETASNLAAAAAATLTANPSLDESEDAAVVAKRRPRKKKKKRKDKFETFKGFCQAVVNKMMAQQEEFHNKMIEDIAKRDEEKIARDEARNKEEMDRLKMEMDIRAKEQAIAAERQATLFQFLKKFTSQHDDDDDRGLLLKVNNNDALINKLETSNSSSIIVAEQTKTKTASDDLITSPSSCLVANTSISSNETHLAWTTKNVHDERGGDDIGKRWPRDEVLALINLRCKTNTNNSNGDNQQDQSGKGPLWERISQGMTELGYKRNAKRCKEKWENINKYFRKTKDSNKKRSINSRTCPYYQQLSCLYSQGTVLVTPTTNVPDNQ